MTRKLSIAFLFLLIFAGITAAQSSGGQMCVRAFEDRNGNGQKDNNEPSITRGLSASLSNAQGVIIETMFIESSTNASSGTMCFQRLEAGQYTMRISSADYMPTTTNEFIGVVSDTGIPVVFPYGGQVIPIQVASSSTSDSTALSASEQQTFFLKVVFAGIGALIIMGAMVVVGAIIYFAFLRNRQQVNPNTASYPRVPDTGSYAPVSDTGSYASVPDTGSHAPVTDSGSYIPPSLDDTDQIKAPEEVDDVVSSMYEDTDLPQNRATVIAPPPDPYQDTPDDDFSFEPDDEADDPNSSFRPPDVDDPDAAFRPKG